jgi:glycosyltransferase involved in cell wall biosynthesis
MNSDKISIAILTRNEEKNIINCLNALIKFKKVIVFDSFSDDNTRGLCRKFANVKLVNTNKKLSYVDKLNFIIKKIKSEWLLILDADYVLSKSFYSEINALILSDNYAYQFKIYNKINNQLILEDLYPTKTLLFQVKKFFFKKEGHKEKVVFLGKKKLLKSYIIHYDLKSFKFWIINQFNYAKIDGNKNLSIKFQKLKIQDKIRRFIFLMNFTSFVYYFFYKKLYKYGLSGIIYVIQRQIYEFFLSIRIFYLLFLK